MKRVLELIIEPDSRKKREFSQTLNTLATTLQSACSSLKIYEAKDSATINLTFKWKTAADMHQTLKRNELTILSGAITALCDKIEIRLDDKRVGDHMSILDSL